MIVEIRPAPITGILYNGTDSTTAFQVNKPYNAVVNGDTRQYVVDISDERLEELGKILGVDLSRNVRMDGEPHPFYDLSTGYVKLEPGTNFFNTSIPMQELYVGILKGRPEIAKSREEFDQQPSEYQWYIYSEEEELQAKESVADQKRKAFKLYEKMSTDRMRQLVTILKGESLVGRSDGFVKAYTWENLVEDATKVEEFVKVASLKPDEITTRYVIMYGYLQGIVTKNGSNYIYDGTTLGATFDQAVENMAKPEFQPMLLVMMDKLNIGK